MVPPRSDRISRVPPYSRTPACPYPYRAVTVSGAPFQALPVRKQKATGLVRVRSPLLAESLLLSFPPATEMVQFAGFAARGYGFTARYPKGVGCPIRTSEDHRALAPPLGFSQRATSFIASRYQGIHQMPFMCCARAQPRARGYAACRDQRAELRGQIKMPHVPASLPFSGLCDLFSWDHAHTSAPADARASASRIPMLQAQPHPHLSEDER